MSDLLDLTLDATAIGLGLFFIAYTLWRVAVHRQRADVLSPRAARVWKWRIVLGLCWGSMGLLFGSDKLLRYMGVDVGAGGFDWLLVPGTLAAVGFVVALLMMNNP